MSPWKISPPWTVSVALAGSLPMLLERMAAGELVTEHLATHVMPLEDGPRGCAMVKDKTDGCVRAVFRP